MEKINIGKQMVLLTPEEYKELVETRASSIKYVLNMLQEMSDMFNNPKYRAMPFSSVAKLYDFAVKDMKYNHQKLLDALDD